jgi:hypothetical protein
MASVVAMGWYWLGPKPAPTRDVHPTPLSSPTADAHGEALPASASSEARAASSGPRNLGEDPRCIIRTTPSPEPADAGTQGTAPAETAATAATDASRERLMQALRTSADPYANAVAVWLDIAEDETNRAARDRRLAAMAASTRDPRLYALALRACWRKPGQECQSLSARRWSELDPDNAMPWLMMMDEAALHRDISGVQEALYRATHARQLAERAQAPVQAIVDAASDDPASLVAARSLAIEAIGIAAAQAGPASVMACRQATPADANLWQECTAMVDLLEHRSDSLFARMVGATIDKHQTGNGEPAQRVAARLHQLMALDLASSSSCSDLRAKLSLMRRMAVDGEMAALPLPDQ